MKSITEFRAHLKALRVARRIKNSLPRSNTFPFKLKIKCLKSGPLPYDILIVRDDNGNYTCNLLGQDVKNFVGNVGIKIECYLYWLSLCPQNIRAATFCTDDGEKPSLAQFSPSSANKKVVLIPDPFFYINKGFSAIRLFSETNGVEWRDRRAAITWRGGMNGPGRLDFSDNAAFDPTVSNRLRMMMIGKTIYQFDAKFVSDNKLAANAATVAYFGFLSNAVPETDWINDKFAIDIDGWTNTWSNLIVRMHLGCCVLKVDSQFGYRQWYYDRIKPWEHFVPVKADMSDLAEKVEWVRTHDATAERIAANGQAFARTMTFESEAKVAAETITHAVSASKTKLQQRNDN